MNKNDDVVLDINDVGINFEGIAKKDGITVFVPYTITNERVNAKIINTKHSFYISKVNSILTPSIYRQTPPCPYFYKCGGCDCQHILYDQALKTKGNFVLNALNKIAGINVEKIETVASPLKYNYRNKFAFPVVFADGKTSIGMFKKASHQIIEIDKCIIEDDFANIVLDLTRQYINSYNIKGYDEINHSGILRHIVGRKLGDSVLITLVVTKQIDVSPFINLLKSQFDKFGVYLNINNKNTNVIFGDRFIHVFGLKSLQLNEFNIQYNVGPQSFIQVNTDVKNLIYKQILDNVNKKTVIDAYSGAGLLSAILASKATFVYGIELVKEATNAADELKKLNNLNNLFNYNGDTKEILPQIIAKHNIKDYTLVLDPPRKGIDKSVVDTLLKYPPQKIIYLSCLYNTLSRDISYLKDYYNITSIKAYDMFPQTKHIETLIIMEKK